MKQGVFIERDGILNKVRVERQHQISPLTLEEFHVNKALAPLLSKLKAGGLVLIATTNQPGLSRGYQSRRELDRMHEVLRRTLPWKKHALLENHISNQRFGLDNRG